MSSTTPFPTTGTEAHSTSRWLRRVSNVAAAVFLLGAIVAPFTSNWLGWWAALVPVLSGLLVLAAVFLTRGSGGLGNRSLELLAVLSPHAARYLEMREANAVDNSRNGTRHANMAACLVAYRLVDDAAAFSSPPPLDFGKHPDDLTTLCRRALVPIRAAQESGIRPGALPDDHMLAECLAVLFASHYSQALLPTEGGEVPQWARWAQAQVHGLAEVVQRHEVFDFALEHRVDIVEGALENLRRSSPYNLSLVVQVVRGEPQQAVATMRTVARRYGYGAISDEEAAEIAAGLLVAPPGAVPATVAAMYALHVDRKGGDAGQARLELELLYRAHAGFTTFNLWKTTTADVRRRLAARLISGGQLGSEPPAAKVVESVLDEVGDFKLEVIGRACDEITQLQRLAENFVADTCKRNAVPPCTRWHGDSLPVALIELLRAHHALPANEAALVALGHPRLAVDLVRTIAADHLAGLECASTEEGPRTGAGHPRLAVDLVPTADPKTRLGALAFTAAGLYLVAGHRRPGLASVLGSEARAEGPLGSPVGDFVATILMARMWRREADIRAGGGEQVIPLATLLCEWPDWRKAAEDEYGTTLAADLLAVIGQRVRHGDWPTRMPVELLLQRFGDRISDEFRSNRLTLEEPLAQMKDYVERLRKSPDFAPGPDGERLVDRVDRSEPESTTAERERMWAEIARAAEQMREAPIEELSGRLSELATNDHEALAVLEELRGAESKVAGAVAELRLTDEGLVRRVVKLEARERRLVDVIAHLADEWPATSHRYLLTFAARSGALGGLIDYLGHPRPDVGEGRPEVGAYDFEPRHTPYARVGRLPPDEDFPSFVDRLEGDLSNVVRCRNAIAPHHDWESHPLRGAVVTVQQIGWRDERHIGPPQRASGRRG